MQPIPGRTVGDLLRIVSEDTEANCLAYSTKRTPFEINIQPNRYKPVSHDNPETIDLYDHGATKSSPNSSACGLVNFLLLAGVSL